MHDPRHDLPVLDPTHPDGPRGIVPLMGEFPVEAFTEQIKADVKHLAQRARVPEWVVNVEKWQTLSRAERRALERHHRREARRR